MIVSLLYLFPPPGICSQILTGDHLLIARPVEEGVREAESSLLYDDEWDRNDFRTSLGVERSSLDTRLVIPKHSKRIESVKPNLVRLSERGVDTSSLVKQYKALLLAR